MTAKLKTLGIDLGTTNSVAGRDFKALEVSGSEADPCILPSVVAYPPSGKTVVGRAARARRPFDAPNTIVSAKRVIGVRWGSSYARKYAERYAYKLVEAGEQAVGYQTRSGMVTPKCVGQKVVEELCETAGVDAATCSAVVSVPVSFGDVRRQATSEAVRGVGFPLVRVIEEPVATALAYLNRSSLKYAFVYDLGGGTFDAAIVDCSHYPFKVIGHGGDPYLGGDDVDERIASFVAAKALRMFSWDLRADVVAYQKLLAACERAKRELSQIEQTALPIQQVDEAAPDSCGTVMLSQEEIRKETLDLVRRTFVICDEVLAQARLKARDIEAVFLAGGSTRLPGVREYVESYFDKRPRDDLNPMHVVSLGASLAAARPAVSDLLSEH